jgi:zinc/manganese transport system substrate-binding protein
MKITKYLFAGLLASMLNPAATASLNVFACEPEWAALAKELGGDAVKVYSAITAFQDPHRIEARPSLIAQARSADLVICTGAELELGWLPLLLTQSGNANIQPGRLGYMEAANLVPRLEIPTRLDRALGDLHAAGNPHIHLDPRNIATVAEALGARMAQLDSGNAKLYQSRLGAFLERWRTAIANWEKQAASLKGLSIITHHNDSAYLNAWLGLKQLATLEPKPGIPPTAAYLSELLAQVQNERAQAILRSAYTDPRPSEWLSERAKIRVVVLPYTVGGTEQAGDLFGLFDETLKRLLAVAS